MYLWLVEDFVVVLLSLRLDAMIIRVVQPTNATIFHRLTWDPGIWLMDGLQFDTLLRSVAGFVFRLGSRATCRFI